MTDANPTIQAGTPVSFNEDITIFLDQPRASLERAGVQVFTAKGEDRAPPKLLAYLCNPQIPARTTLVSAYSAINNPHMPRLISAGLVSLAGGQRRYAFIYEDTLGSSIVSPSDHLAYSMRPEVLVNAVIKPMVSVFYDLQNTNIMHGAIRPQNMFVHMNEKNMERFVLGEPLSTPVSYEQPVLYETILRGMTDRAARGMGTIQDDLYSFGATLAVLIRGTDPLRGLSDDEIIRAKHELGSFNALFGKDNQNGPHTDLLRGLLQDDAGLRWTVSDVEGWLEGRRQTPKTGARKKKAARPLVINGEKYIYPELLAYDVYKNPSECARLIENGEVEQWIVRALDDNQTEMRYQKFADYIDNGGPKEMQERRMLSCLSIALHPEAPLRYESLAVMPQGFGTAFSETVMQKGNIRPYIDLINMRIVVHWLEAQEIGVVDISSIFSRFDACRNYLSQTTNGFGFERCVYELDPECPCLSEKIVSYGARLPEDVLMGFEESIEHGSDPVRLFDRHVTAFLMARDRKNIEPYLHDLNSGSEQKRLLSELQTLATIQKRTRSKPVPALAKWFAGQGKLFLERIHDREERKKISGAFDTAAKTGDLSRLLTLVDDPRMKMKDIAGFNHAMHEYRALRDERDMLERELDTNPRFGRAMGRAAAAGLSAILAFIIICLTVAALFSGGGSHF